MQLNDHLKRIVKILIFAFLCTEMQTSYTHRDLIKQHGIGMSDVPDNKRSHRVPYQASIRLAELEKDYYGKGHICSGALVGPSVVVTIAQCIYNNASKSYYHPAELSVVLGSSQRFAPTAQSQVYGVTHVYQPPKDLSLAILMLQQDVPTDQPLIQPISLAMGPTPTKQAMQLWHISGWGRSMEDGEELHEMLKCTLKDYQEKYSRYELDLGAPIIQSNQLFALRSGSNTCGLAFVDVASHVDWILAKTGDGSNQNSSIWGILGLLVFTVYVIKCSHKSLFT